MKIRKRFPLLASLLVAAAAHAGPLKLSFVLGEPTAEEIEWGAPKAAQGIAILPDDSLITTGTYDFYWQSSYGWGEDDPIPELLYTWANISYPDRYDNDWTNGEYIDRAFESRDGPAFHVVFHYWGDNRATGGFSGGDWNDGSFYFVANERNYWLQYAGMYENFWVDNLPGYWTVEPYRVPEPGTLLLLTGSLAALALSRRRQQS